MQHRWPVISSPLYSFSRRGRKSLYKPEFCFRVKSSCAQTASNIGVSKRTIITWCQKHPEFKKAQTFESVRVQQALVSKKIEKLLEQGKQLRTGTDNQ